MERVGRFNTCCIGRPGLFPYYPGMRCACTGLLLLLPFSLLAEPTNALVDARALGHYREALEAINLLPDDARFTRDVAKPRLVLQRVRTMLREPLALTALGSEIQAVGADTDRLMKLAAELLDPAAPVEIVGADTSPLEIETLDPALADALNELYVGLLFASAITGRLQASATDEEKSYVAATLFGGTFRIEDIPEAYEALKAAGFSDALLGRVIAENNVLDPEPDATYYLDIVEKLPVSRLPDAAAWITEALDRFEASATNLTWPATSVVIDMPLGPLVLGSAGNDQFTNRCLAIIDPGGDDTYSGAAASADGINGMPVNVVLDLAGNDRYAGKSLLGPGSALFGLHVLRDRRGDDLYTAKYTGQAAAAFGFALVEDHEGQDIYRAHAFAQGAGYAGVGILSDHAGEDLYDLGFGGQAYAGVKGVGLLVDRDGNDRYVAGGRMPNFDNHDDRYNSFAQGCAFGMRPFAGGGVAALVDLAGSDSYQADVFGQGVGYWYGAGFLLDRAGNDTYNVYHYGQGSGIHLALGLLADGGGDDFYTGHILAQGNAHDFAVGILLDATGKDAYSADHHAQGRAIFNSFAMLMDREGNDAYFARQPSKCQGAGHDGHHRDYGSMALLVDLAGWDWYSCGAQDGTQLERDDTGVLLDVEEP